MSPGKICEFTLNKGSSRAWPYVTARSRKPRLIATGRRRKPATSSQPAINYTKGIPRPNDHCRKCGIQVC
jgi:hypothetical protein